MPDAARKAVMENVLDKAMGVAAPVKKLLVLLTEQRKLDLLERPGRGVSRAAARAPQHRARRSDERRAALAGEDEGARTRASRKSPGKKVELSTSVDPGLLGGVVAKIGSTVYDGSVKTQLEQLRKELSEQ